MQSPLLLMNAIMTCRGKFSHRRFSLVRISRNNVVGEIVQFGENPFPVCRLVIARSGAIVRAQLLKGANPTNLELLTCFGHFQNPLHVNSVLHGRCGQANFSSGSSRFSYELFFHCSEKRSCMGNLKPKLIHWHKT